MIIHIWMHWFWITTKGFLFLSTQSISLSCISHLYLTEAKSLETTTNTPEINPNTGYNSSQILHNLNITSPIIIELESSKTTTAVPVNGTTTTTTTTTAATTQHFQPTAKDTEDTYNGHLDSFQFQIKKSTKYKKVKGKMNLTIDEGGGTTESPTTTIDEKTTTTAAGAATGTTIDSGTEEIINETLIIENKVEESESLTTADGFVVRNRVAASTSAQNVMETEMNAGSITGITLGILVVFSLFGAVSFVLYRRRYLNKPQVLHDKCSNLDSSGYIDETSLRENSEEMYSLDNDSFLNSLEAMTIQNYWTENVKHTKL